MLLFSLPRKLHCKQTEPPAETPRLQRPLQTELLPPLWARNTGCATATHQALGSCTSTKRAPAAANLGHAAERNALANPCIHALG